MDLEHKGINLVADITEPIGLLVLIQIPIKRKVYGVDLAGSSCFHFEEDKKKGLCCS